MTQTRREKTLIEQFSDYTLPPQISNYIAMLFDTIINGRHDTGSTLGNCFHYYTWFDYWPFQILYLFLRRRRRQWPLMSTCTCVCMHQSKIHILEKFVTQTHVFDKISWCVIDKLWIAHNGIMLFARNKNGKNYEFSLIRCNLCAPVNLLFTTGDRWFDRVEQAI